MSSPTESVATSTQRPSDLLRAHLSNLCRSALKSLVPEDGAGNRGLWSEEDLRILMAILEIERVRLDSELENPLLHPTAISKIIEKLGTTNLFPDPRSPRLLEEMEQLLRVLATALRLYKYHGTCLHHRLHDDLYKGINKLDQIFQNHRSQRDENQLIEDWNVAFLLQHCQYLLVSIDSDYSLAKKASRRFMLAIDKAPGLANGQYGEARKLALALAKRKRSRPSWHAQFLDMEDECWALFAGDLSIQLGLSGSLIESLLMEESGISDLLRESMEEQFEPVQPRKGRINRAFRKIVGVLSRIVSDSGPFEENAEYLKYGILDLMYQLTFRIQSASKTYCFEQFSTIIRCVLERSHPSASLLHMKALDIWNRITYIGKKDVRLYGRAFDREQIEGWKRRSRARNESMESAKAYDPNLHW